MVRILGPDGDLDIQSEGLGDSISTDKIIGSIAGLVVLERAISRLTNQQEQAVPVADPRETMARQLLTRGHASVDELLHASYGEWPPRGLNIIGENEQTVNLTPLLERFGRPAGIDDAKFAELRAEELKYVGGRGSIEGERWIGINDNRIADGRPVNSVTGHEVAHILQGDHRARATEIFGHHYSWQLSLEEDHVSNMAAHELFSAHIDQEKASVVTLPESLIKNGGLAYLQEGLEVQARLHQVLMDGYQRWGRMPLNTEELTVALDDAGFRAPPEIAAELNKSPTIQKTLKTFSTNNTVHNSAVNDLRLLQGVLTEQGQAKMSRETMPMLYSDLIEMYGDELGRARFGLGENPRIEARIASLPNRQRMMPEMWIANDDPAQYGKGFFAFKDGTTEREQHLFAKEIGLRRGTYDVGFIDESTVPVLQITGGNPILEADKWAQNNLGTEKIIDLRSFKTATPSHVEIYRPGKSLEIVFPERATKQQISNFMDNGNFIDSAGEPVQYTIFDDHQGNMRVSTFFDETQALHDWVKKEMPEQYAEAPVYVPRVKHEFADPAEALEYKQQMERVLRKVAPDAKVKMIDERTVVFEGADSIELRSARDGLKNTSGDPFLPQETSTNMLRRPEADKQALVTLQKENALKIGAKPVGPPPLIPVETTLKAGALGAGLGIGFGVKNVASGIINKDGVQTALGLTEIGGGAATIALTNGALSGSMNAAKVLPVVGAGIIGVEGIYGAAKPWMGKEAEGKHAVTKSLESVEAVAGTAGAITYGVIATNAIAGSGLAATTTTGAVGVLAVGGAVGGLLGGVVVGGSAYIGHEIGTHIVENQMQNDTTFATEHAQSEAKFNNLVAKNEIGHYVQLSKLAEKAGLKGKITSAELEKAIADKQAALDNRGALSKSWDFTKSVIGIERFTRSQTPAEREVAELESLKQELQVYKKVEAKSQVVAAPAAAIPVPVIAAPPAVQVPAPQAVVPPAPVVAPAPPAPVVQAPAAPPVVAPPETPPEAVATEPQIPKPEPVVEPKQSQVAKPRKPQENAARKPVLHVEEHKPHYQSPSLPHYTGKAGTVSYNNGHGVHPAASSGDISLNPFAIARSIGHGLGAVAETVFVNEPRKIGESLKHLGDKLKESNVSHTNDANEVVATSVKAQKHKAQVTQHLSAH